MWTAIEAEVEREGGEEVEDAFPDAVLTALFWAHGYDDLDDVPEDVRRGRTPAPERPDAKRRVFTVLTQAQLEGEDS